MDAAMDALVALAPSALGLDGAALVSLWIKGERAWAATRLQGARVCGCEVIVSRELWVHG